MTPATPTRVSPLPPPVSPTTGYTGQVVYMYAFDVAYEMIRRPVDRLLGQPVAEFAPGAGKRQPRQWFFYRPQMVRLPPLERLTARGPIRVERSVKLLPVGAISITVRASGVSPGLVCTNRNA